jgi:hypothetical protein
MLEGIGRVAPEVLDFMLEKQKDKRVILGC